MDIGFEGRRTLIVGASQGIGLATAKVMAKEGAALMLAARNEAPLAEAANAVTALGAKNPATFALDVTKAGEVDRLAKDLAARWDSLDCLVSAVGGSVRSSFEDLTDEDWIANYTFNVLSTVRLARAFLPALKRGKSPAIVFVGAASAKMPTAHQIVSNVHKAGLLGLAKTLATELAPDGIRVNTVGPGRTMTRLWTDRAKGMAKDRGVPEQTIYAEFSKDIPLNRFGEPEEIGTVITWLASPRASYVTGQHVNADGGLSRGLL